MLKVEITLNLDNHRMRRWIRFVLALPVVLMLLGGCGRQSPFSLHDASTREAILTLAKQSAEAHGVFHGKDFYTNYSPPGGVRKTYHFKNATIYPGAGFSYLSQADKLNGIDLRTIVLLRADAYREQGITDWTEWKNGASPALKFALTVERKNGTLKASSREELRFFSRPMFGIPADT